MLQGLCQGPDCTVGEFSTEMVFCLGTDDGVLENNLNLSKVVVNQLFGDLEKESSEEKVQYEKTRLQPSTQKANRWATYTDKERLREFMSRSMDFVRKHAECRVRVLGYAQLRFLVLLQHLVSEDTDDFHKPEKDRKHQDVFEGFLTDSVNSQLIKDAHRSEWSVEGRTFSVQGKFAEDSCDGVGVEDRKQAISVFQHDFVSALEDYLLEFCRRRGLSLSGTRRLLQSVTTQMSQCGLANLERSSQAAKYFVNGQGLDQQTAYNISTMDSGTSGEALKLSMFCMKTGFTQYHTEETLGLPAHSFCLPSPPRRCHPSSFLYQYATLRFLPASLRRGCDRINCDIIDALDEVHMNSMK